MFHFFMVRCPLDVSLENFKLPKHMTNYTTEITASYRSSFSHTRSVSNLPPTPANLSSIVTQIEDVIAYIKKYLVQRTRFTKAL